MLKVAPRITPATSYRIVSGVQIHEIPTPSEQPPPSVTITVEEESFEDEPVEAHVTALCDVIERFSVKGLLSAWPVIDLFPFMQPVHWMAFAREAGVPIPDQATRRAARAAYRTRHGYEGPEVKDDVLDETPGSK